MAYVPMTPICGLRSESGAPQLELGREQLTLPAMAPSQRYADRYHVQSYYELIFFVRGTRLIRVGNQAYSCGPGSIIAMNPDEPHCGFTDVPVTYDRYVLHIYPDALLPFTDSTRLLRCFLHRPYCQNNLLELPPDARSEAFRLIAEAHLLRTADVPQCYFILLRLLALLGRACPNLHPQTQHPALLQQILQAIGRDDGTMTVASLARNFGMSRTALWRLFRSYFNVSPQQYLQMVEQIADLCGRGDRADLLLLEFVVDQQLLFCVGDEDISLDRSVCPEQHEIHLRLFNRSFVQHGAVFGKRRSVCHRPHG